MKCKNNSFSTKVPIQEINQVLGQSQDKEFMIGMVTKISLESLVI